MAQQPPYYADQSDWTPVDWQGLWRYLNRLFGHIAIKAELARQPETLAYQIRARRAGSRDAELASLDLSRMSAETTYLMKHMLIHAGLYDIALAKFANLRGLEDVDEIDHPIVLDENPTGIYPYYTDKGILL